MPKDEKHGPKVALLLLLEALGALLVAGGLGAFVAIWSLPAALLVAGAVLIVAGEVAR